MPTCRSKLLWEPKRDEIDRQVYKEFCQWHPTSSSPLDDIFLILSDHFPINFFKLRHSDVAFFSFADLCDRPLGAADYLAIGHAFHTVAWCIVSENLQSTEVNTQKAVENVKKMCCDSIGSWPILSFATKVFVADVPKLTMQEHGPEQTFDSADNSNLCWHFSSYVAEAWWVSTLLEDLTLPTLLQTTNRTHLLKFLKPGCSRPCKQQTEQTANREERDQVRRFITLIDTLYETHTKLVCTAELDPIPLSLGLLCLKCTWQNSSS